MIAQDTNLPVLSLNEINLKNIRTDIFPIPYLYQQRVLPFQNDQKQLWIAVIDPAIKNKLEKEIGHLNLSYQYGIADNEQMEKWLCRIAMPHYLSLLQTNSSALNTADPLIAYVNCLIRYAIQQKASDIHIENESDESRIRFRQDGLLQPITHLSKSAAKRIISHFKIAAKLDIAEQRLPQDGHFRPSALTLPAVDIRVSTCPSLHGEKMVLRLLEYQTQFRKISELGFSKTQEQSFLSAITKPQGLILVTGPTGSGKTVTLYAALHKLNEPTKNIMTIEDPVEIHLPGINQVTVHSKIGLTFPKALRAFLRQDPDIIMVGEIRDTETAEIAIKAAQTGHLVLSTLHTNNTTQTFTRLSQMGIPSHDLLDSLLLITAQRLLRVLCPHCKQIHSHISFWQKKLNVSQSVSIYEAKGCSHCTQGYSGRCAIHEMLPITENFRQTSNVPKNPTINLWQAGCEKIVAGLTSPEELNRIIDSESYE